ncbi:hypothetical protein GCM10010407_13210 [Rarobacter incanus]
MAAGKLWDIPTIGTAAHAFTLLHDDEQQAFDSQVRTLGRDTTLLVDTYDIPEAVRRAVAAAGDELGAVRIDSGDLGILAAQVREILDQLGANETKITVTSDLDEYAIAALAAAPVDSFGVGTRLVTGSGAPTCSMVYKLVARSDDSGDMVPVAKRSAGKPSLGGYKRLLRQFSDAGVATNDLVLVGDEPSVRAAQAPAGSRDLHVIHIDGGQIVSANRGVAGLARAAQRHRMSRGELPLTALRLSSGEPAVPVTHAQAEPI